MLKKPLLQKILLPLARFCVRRSVRLQDFTEAFKEALVRAAQAELANKTEGISSSRLSVMTGVHRKDVRRILSQSEEPFKKNVIERVMGQWQQDSRFTTQGGKARTLSLEGSESEFAELVRSVSVDLNPYTVLFELERIQAVVRTRRGVRLEMGFYFPTGNINDGFNLLAEDLHDLISAVEENLFEEPEPLHLHLKTQYDRIPQSCREQIDRWLLREGTLFHRKVRRYLSRFDRDINPQVKGGGESTRVAVGLFGYSESAEDAGKK